MARCTNLAQRERTARKRGGTGVGVGARKRQRVRAEVQVLGCREIDTGRMRKPRHEGRVGIAFFEIHARAVGQTRLHTGDHAAAGTLSGEQPVVGALVAGDAGWQPVDWVHS